MTEKLSDKIGELVAVLDSANHIPPHAVAAMVELNRRVLPLLHLFAADFEFAEGYHTPGASTHLAANAAVRLYRQLAGLRDTPAVHAREPNDAAGAAVIYLANFRGSSTKAL